jgi:hypothetical protein
MTPQANLMIMAAVDPTREADLRALLQTMNIQPDRVDPHNPLLPFAEFDRLHFCRLLILDDLTLDDITIYGLPRVDYPKYLALMCDFDGAADSFLRELAQRAGDGLQRIFAHCQDYSANANLLAWMRAHNMTAAASYVNWVGRTARQVREEEALRQLLESSIEANAPSFATLQPRQIYDRLLCAVAIATKNGRLTLTPEQPTPPGWQAHNLLHLLAVPLLLLLASPLLLVYLPIFLVQLRLHERADAVLAPRVDPSHADLLASIEDYDVTNQFSAMGTLKPGLFRQLTTRFVLLAIDYTARHVFNRSRLGRVTTIHFARWVRLDGGRRVIFASNYDGGLESYMDDFINKVAFGLNIVFSNGVGYPRTNWLILDGAKDEQNFKNYLRRHQMPTQVWYNAHPGLTALDRKRNMLIREGIEKTAMSDEEIQQWLRLL